MRSLLRLPVLAPLGLLAALTATGLAQRSAAPPAAATAADATARIVTAAQAVLATLDDAGNAPRCSSLRQSAEDALVEPAERHFRAPQPAAGRSHTAADAPR